MIQLQQLKLCVLLKGTTRSLLNPNQFLQLLHAPLLNILFKNYWIFTLTCMQSVARVLNTVNVCKYIRVRCRSNNLQYPENIKFVTSRLCYCCWEVSAAWVSSLIRLSRSSHGQLLSPVMRAVINIYDWLHNTVCTANRISKSTCSIAAELVAEPQQIHIKSTKCRLGYSAPRYTALRAGWLAGGGLWLIYGRQISIVRWSAVGCIVTRSLYWTNYDSRQYSAGGCGSSRVMPIDLTDQLTTTATYTTYIHCGP